MKTTRKNLIKSGYTAFLTKGYNATGIQELTDSISISKGAFYNHFKHKDIFASEVVDDFADQLEQEYKQLLLKTDRSPLEQLREFYTNKIRAVREVTIFKNGCMVSNLCQEVADKNENIAVAVDHAFEIMAAPIQTCLENAIEQGELKEEVDCGQLAEHILNSWNGALMRVKASKNDKALQAFMYGLEKLLE